MIGSYLMPIKGGYPPPTPHPQNHLNLPTIILPDQCSLKYRVRPQPVVIMPTVTQTRALLVL